MVLMHGFSKAVLWMLMAVFIFINALRMQQLATYMQDLATMRGALIAELAEEAAHPAARGGGGATAHGGAQAWALQMQLLTRDHNEGDYNALLALDEEAAQRPSGVPAERLAALPTHEWRGGEGAGVGAPTCAVCLEAAVEGDLLRTLPCAHSFHVACIDRWLSGSTFCPVCKTPAG